MRQTPPSEGGEAGWASSPTFDLDQSIGFLVYRAQLSMNKELARQFRPHDITPEQWAVLNRLWEEDGRTQRERADVTFKDGPTMTRILRRLEDKGLVSRNRAPGDARASRVRLTPEARALIPQLIPRAVCVLEKSLAGIEPGEAAIAKKVLGRMFVNLAWD